MVQPCCISTATSFTTDRVTPSGCSSKDNFLCVVQIEHSRRPTTMYRRSVAGFPRSTSRVAAPWSRTWSFIHAPPAVTLFGLNDRRQGIVHVVGPEQGLSQPGMIIVCGDSHTATHGALGALAFGAGASEVAHVLATQTLWQTKPKNMRVTVDGSLAPGVHAKDVILAIIAKISAAATVWDPGRHHRSCDSPRAAARASPRRPAAARADERQL